MSLTWSLQNRKVQCQVGLPRLRKKREDPLRCLKGGWHAEGQGRTIREAEERPRVRGFPEAWLTAQLPMEAKNADRSLLGLTIRHQAGARRLGTCRLMGCCFGRLEPSMRGKNSMAEGARRDEGDRISLGKGAKCFFPRQRHTPFQTEGKEFEEALIRRGWVWNDGSRQDREEISELSARTTEETERCPGCQDTRVGGADFKGAEAVEWPPGSWKEHLSHAQPSPWPRNQWPGWRGFSGAIWKWVAWAAKHWGQNGEEKMMIPARRDWIWGTVKPIPGRTRRRKPGADWINVCSTHISVSQFPKFFHLLPNLTLQDW